MRGRLSPMANTVKHLSFPGFMKMLKRVIDILLGSLLLVLTFPLTTVIVIGIKLSSPGPIFFRQWRAGLNGKPFLIYKFRTMTVCEDKSNIKQVIRDVNRITTFGAFLRHRCLDELPQFINVLQGRMSIVGPRPHPLGMDDEFRKKVSGYALRQKMKPGITGLAQIYGFRGEIDSFDKINKRTVYDIEYINSWSVIGDLKIILLTPMKVFLGNNAYRSI